GHACEVFSETDLAHLGAARLSRHFEARLSDAPGEGGAAGFVGDAVHSGAHSLDRMVGERQRRKFRSRLTLFADHTNDARADQLSAGDARRHGAELERRDEHIALADTGVQRLALQPFDAVGRFFPRAPRNDARAFAGDFDSRLLAKSQPVRAGFYAVDAETARNVVE